MRFPHLRALCFAVLLLLLVTNLQANGQTTRTPSLDWREFKSEAGGFSIKLPGEPKVSDLPLEKGPLTLMRHSHVISVAGFPLDIEYVEMPRGFHNPSLSLEGGISGLRHST